MKRDGYIIEEIIDQKNLEDSFDTVVRGTERKNSVEGKWLIANREWFLAQVKQEIISGHLNLMPMHRTPTDEELRNGGFHTRDILEAGKLRHIQVFCMAARIKVNAVMEVADRHIKRRFIRTTSSSIKGRGMHDLMAYIEDDLRKRGNIRYWYQNDIRKCYETVVQDFVMYAYRHVFKDETFLRLIEQFTRMLPEGISMGLRSSQGSLNLLLSVYLDHFIKDQMGCKYAYRYCDDNVAGASSKMVLWAQRDMMHERMGIIGQEIKPTERVFPAECGLDFLGYVIYPSHTKLRKRVKQNFARKLSKVKSRKRRMEIVGSLWGMAKHCKSVHLLKTILYPSEFNRIKKKIDKMKQFSELGISYKPADGKKRFPNRAVQLRQLTNVRIEVLDYEDSVKTKYGERCLVMFRDTRTNELSKFFTDCEEMKQALAAAKDMGEIPFSTVITAEYFGEGKTKYKFT